MRKFNDEKVDWEVLWNKLENSYIANGEDSTELTLCEKNALGKFSEFLGKMNPPEDDRISIDARRDNDKKFSEFIKSQFKYLER